VRLRRDQKETPEGLEEERRVLAERYTLDADEAQKYEQRAAEAAERRWARRLEEAAARESEEEARYEASRVEPEFETDRDLLAELDQRAELVRRTTFDTEPPAPTEYTSTASEPLYGGDVPTDDTPSREIERVRELSRAADLLVEIADTVRAEGGVGGGHLAYRIEQSRLPILRGRLAIALAAARVFGAPDLEACRRVVEDLPNFAAQAVVGVLAAIEELRETLTSSFQPGESGLGHPSEAKPILWGETPQQPKKKKKRKKEKKSQSDLALVTGMGSEPFPAIVFPAQPLTAAEASPTESELTMPKRVTQAWIEANVPTMSAATLEEFLSELRKRNWSTGDIESRVIPHTQS
jgi:8-oxo-dGTP pyrophosphatase MutT (NUDIX family)